MYYFIVRQIKQNISWQSFVTPALLGVLSVGLLFLFSAQLSQNKTQSKNIPSIAPKVDIVHQKALALINKNLQDDARVLELKEQAIELNNEKFLDQINQKLKHQMATVQLLNQQGLGVEVFVDDGSSAVYEDLNEKNEVYDSQLTPAEKIELKMQRTRELADYQLNQKKQFVRAFLENARKKGVDVVLNDQLEVVNVRRIRADQPYVGDVTIDDLFK
ncbi:MAG: hypothetical protein KDD34_01125 [Bdellovibrionales bacterium]|nr:hypothetical protein [Bdellovibrionales bacterium]